MTFNIPSAKQQDISISNFCSLFSYFTSKPIKKRCSLWFNCFYIEDDDHDNDNVTISMYDDGTVLSAALHPFDCVYHSMGWNVGRWSPFQLNTTSTSTVLVLFEWQCVVYPVLLCVNLSILTEWMICDVIQMEWTNYFRMTVWPMTVWWW